MERVALADNAVRLFAGRPAARLALLRALWPRAVGPELARRTRVEAVDGTTLRIRVPDAGWRRQLHRMQPRLIQSLRALAGPLAPRRLGFVEGGLTDAPPEPPGPPALSPAPLSAELRSQAAGIEDDEIRAAFLESASRYLGRVRRPERERSEDRDA